MRRLFAKPFLLFLTALIAVGSLGLNVSPAFAAPTVSFASPADEARVRGTVTLRANASDPLHPIASVKFLLRGTNELCDDTTGPSPYTCSWNTTTVADGRYAMVARARNDIGEEASVTIFLNVDNTAPTVTNVTSAAADGSYRAGRTVDVQVVFSEAVNVTDTVNPPTITLATGSPASTVVRYISGTGTNTLTFRYTVVAGNASSDLTNIANSLTTGGGRIVDLAGNTAVLTMPGGSATGSLGFNKAIVIDTTGPTSGSVSINGGAATTTSSNVTLSLACTDAVACTQMQIAPDGTLDTEAFVAFATTASTTLLPSGTGTRTVAVRFRDAAGNLSATFTDSIDVVSAAQPPTVTFISPVPLNQGDVEQMMMTGTNFVAGSTTVTISGTGVTLGAPTVTSTQINLNATVAANATLGARTVTVTTPGGSATIATRVDPPAPPPTTTASLSANPTSIASGSFTTLTWSSNGTSCTGSGGIGSASSWNTAGKPASGFQQVSNITNPPSVQNFQIICTGPNGNSPPQTATVTVAAAGDTTPPTISNVAAGSVTSTGATITWNTNEPATAQVNFGTTTSYGSNSTLDSTLRTSQSRSLTGLTPSTLYHYRARSADGAGNLTLSGDFTFTTSAAPPSGPVCGNGSCEAAAGETNASCPGDCPPPPPLPPSGPVCGNAVCEGGETTASCPGDCPLPPAGFAACTGTVGSSSPPALPACPAPGSAPSGGSVATGFSDAPLFCANVAVGSSVSCGDGIKGPGEACELGEVQQLQSCQKPDGTRGSLQAVCVNQNGTCAFQPADQATFIAFACGNGTMETGEQCDDGALNGTVNHCGPDCTLAGSIGCGDGFLAGSEQCDCGTPQNFSSLPACSWAKLNNCAASNGQYAATGVTCTFDCKFPGLSCGDRVVNGNELCDANSETYAGKLCDGGPNVGRACTTASNCAGATCGNAAGNAACPTNTSRSRTCNATCNAFGAYTACGATCMNGRVEGTEQCDDGNAIETDGCTNQCRNNVCGDNKLFVGREACDDGVQNGQACTAPYGGVCNFCTPSCQLVTKSGGFCGDSVIDAGHEFCDGAAPMPKSCVNIFTSDRLTTSCTDTADCQAQAQVAITQGSVPGPATNWSCRTTGICNGGPSNGQLCTQEPALACADPGSCVFPDCDNACASACPFGLVTIPVQIQSEVPGSAPANSVDLFSFQNPQGFTPDNATLFLPACSVGTRLLADVDKSNVIPPSMDIVFVTDVSNSMNNPASGGKTRMEVVRESTSQAIGDFIDAALEINQTINIGLVSFSHGSGIDTTCTAEGKRIYTSPDGRACIDSGLDADVSRDKNALQAIVNAYVTIDGTTTFAGLKAGLEMLEDSTADKRILVLLSDGQPDPVDPNGTNGGKKAAMDVLKNGSGTQLEPGIDVYTAIINTSSSLKGFGRHLSDDICPASHFTTCNLSSCGYDSQTGCTAGADGIEYAYSGNTTDEIEDMYAAITQSVLGANVGVTATGGGSTQQTSGSVPEGRSVVLPFPTNFVCTGSVMQLPFNVTFNSDPDSESTINVSNVKFQYCPSR